MGTLKLNKRVTNNEMSQVKAVEKSAEKKLVQALQENVVTNETVEGFELCELAKQDDGFVEEFKNLRTENETVYRRNDRTCRKVITTTPTRYLAENGEYKEIGNRLIDSNKEIINEENSFKVKFNKDKTNGKIFDLQKGKKTITLSAASSAKSRSHKCGCKCELCTDKNNTVTATLDDGTEIQYITLNDRIKENIIVKNQQDSYEYNFTLNIGDLIVEEGENNDLLLKDAETGETEFIIPAPYMYDANKKRSDKVSYEIDVNGEELLIRVVADPEFINANERSFPVIIDPQIVSIGNGSGITFESVLQTFDEDESIEYYPGMLEVYEASSGERSEANVKYTVPKSIKEGVIVNVKLVLTCTEGYGQINVGGTIIEPNNDEYINVEFDVTNSSGGNIKIKPSGRNYSFAAFAVNGDYAPRFVIEYLDIKDPYGDEQYEGESIPTIKEFEFTDKAKGYFYVNSGAVATTFKSFASSDFVLPLNIIHIHKLGLGETNYGLNWRLNLDKKLTVAQDDTEKTTRYIFTDELGDKYIFNEKYYYINGTNKVFVSKNDVAISVNGELTYSNKPVYKYQSCNGYTLISEINDFRNSELIEQRQNEQIQLEEFINSYEPSLMSYVKVYANTGVINSRLSSLTKANYESLISGVNKTSNYLLLTKSEALQLQSLYATVQQLSLQKDQLTLQLNQYNLQVEQYKNQKAQYELQQRQVSFQKDKQLQQQISELNNSMELSKKLYTNYATSVNFSTLSIPAENSDDSKNVDRNHTISNVRERMAYANAKAEKELLTSTDGSQETQTKLLTTQSQLINTQLTTIEKEITATNKQITSINSQITYINKQISLNNTEITNRIEQARVNLELIKDTFIKYFNKKAQLDLLLLRTPINYILDSKNIINGFNKNGDLVLIADNYGNYLNINYNIDGGIADIRDNSGKCLQFEYSNKRLISISDNSGRTVRYSYDSKKLNEVTLADGNSLKFKYQSNLVRTIDSSNELQVKLSYDKVKRLQEILNWSPRISIGKVVVKEKDTFTEEITDWYITYNDNGAIIYSNEGEQEQYSFDATSKIINYRIYDKENNNTVTNYSYLYSNGKQITAVTRYNDDPALTNIKNYNVLDLLISDMDDWKNISDTVRRKTIKFYEYDINNRLISEIIDRYTEVDGVEKIEKQRTNYSYNAKGSLTLIESYVVGEEMVSGKNYEKRVYDDNGNVIKSIKWNSLDSSSKFYSESNYAKNGQVIDQFDEEGNVVTEYEYISETNVVNSVKKANGSKLAYGRNPYNYEINSITHSTAEGESNKTDILYQCGLPVEVKSENTTIDYVYNAKRQKAQISVNNNIQIKSDYKGYYYNAEDETANYITKTDTYFIDNKNAVKICYDKYGDLEEESGILKLVENLTIDNEELYRKNYSIRGLLECVSYKDGDLKTLRYNYDDYDLLIRVSTLQGDTEQMTESYLYDEENKLIQKSFNGLVNHTYSYSYKSDFARSLDYISFDNYKIKPLTDINGRNIGKEIYNDENKIAAEYISYRKVGDHATHMPATVWFGSGSSIKNSIKYKYDQSGNICEIVENGHVVATYVYDSLNRIIREDNKLIDKTTLYSYDQNGNIVERCEYAYTLKSNEKISELDCVHYRYNYDGDKLVGIFAEDGKETFAYNNMGNPTLYRDKKVEWQYGLRLVNFDGTMFAYDGLGRRVKKDNIEFVYDNDGRLISQSNGIEFIYDNSNIIGLKYNKEQFFYRKDIQGNIIAILDSNGKVVVRYIYDCWGNHAIVAETGEDIVDGIGVLNPFRYRGYYYDGETGLYYLQTRYYDPEIGRFISQDNLEFVDHEKINGLNLYAYCLNNPVNFIDYTGEIAISIIVGIIIGIVVGATVGGVVAYTVAKNNGASGWELFAWTLLGIIGGGLIGAALGAAVGAAAPFLGSFLGSSFTLGSFALASGEVITVSITGAQIVAGSLAALIMFSQWVPKTWPGDDPTQSPGDGFEWHGKLPEGGDKGAWFNPETGESLHPDFNHPGMDPHWDWIDPKGIAWRIFRFFIELK